MMILIFICTAETVWLCALTALLLRGTGKDLPPEPDREAERSEKLFREGLENLLNYCAETAKGAGRDE